jgi:hypothetical protein
MQTTRSTRTNLDNTIQLHQSGQSSPEKVTSMCFGQGLVPLRQVFNFFPEELDSLVHSNLMCQVGAAA